MKKKMTSLCRSGYSYFPDNTKACYKEGHGTPQKQPLTSHGELTPQMATLIAPYLTPQPLNRPLLWHTNDKQGTTSARKFSIDFSQPSLTKFI